MEELRPARRSGSRTGGPHPGSGSGATTAGLRCGVFLVAGRHPGQDDAAALGRSIAAVEAAEDAGFDDAWVAEHHFMSYGVCPSALTFAAHALGRTERITVGTAVSVISTVHPVALAEQTALLDQLSDGRFQLGVGRGGPWVDLEVFGTGLDRYERAFPESLDLLLTSLAEGRAGGAAAGADASAAAPGDHRDDGDRWFRFREVPVVPRPRTEPMPPITVACTSLASVELAAARGLPMLLGMDLDDDRRAGMVAHYAKAAETVGRDPACVEHVAAVLAHVATDRERARRELFAAMPAWLAAGLAGYVPVDGRPPPRRDTRRYTEMLCDLHPVGSPEDCAERIRASVEATGIRHLIMMVEGTGDRGRTLETVARLGEEVLPLL